MVVGDNEEWEVEDVVDSRIRYRTLQYRIRWRVYDETTWVLHPSRCVHSAASLTAKELLDIPVNKKQERHRRSLAIAIRVKERVYRDVHTVR